MKVATRLDFMGCFSRQKQEPLARQVLLKSDNESRDNNLVLGLLHSFSEAFPLLFSCVPSEKVISILSFGKKW